MEKKTGPSSQNTGKKSDKKSEREERLVENLRANLRRRKIAGRKAKN